MKKYIKLLLLLQKNQKNYLQKTENEQKLKTQKIGFHQKNIILPQNA